MARKPRATKTTKPANAGTDAAKADDIKTAGVADTANNGNVVDPAQAGDAGDSASITASTGDAGSNDGNTTDQSSDNSPGASDSQGAHETSKPAAQTKAAKTPPKAKDDEPERQSFKVTSQIRRDKKLHRIGEDIDCTAAEFKTFKRLGAIKGEWQE